MSPEISESILEILVHMTAVTVSLFSLYGIVLTVMWLFDVEV